MSYTNDPARDAEAYYNSLPEPEQEICPRCNSQHDGNYEYCLPCINELTELYKENYFNYLLEKEGTLENFTTIEEEIDNDVNDFLWFVENRL